MWSVVLGRLNGVHPEIGTIVGSNWLGEPMVVCGVDDKGCVVRTATAQDVPVLESPRSVAEFKIIPRRKSVFGLIRKLGTLA